MPASRIMEKSLHVPVAGAGLFVKMYAHISERTGEDRPTLVFLHEALGSVGQWKSFPYELCKATGCDGLVYDRKGHGKSSPMDKPRSADFYAEEAVCYLAGLLDTLNVRHPLLVGHSDGATIALKFAASFPERSVAVISEAAHVIIEDVTLDGIQEARRQYESTDLGQKLSRYHGDKTDSVFRAWADTWLSPELASWDMLGDLHGIRCPVLVVQGAGDQYGSRRQVDAIAEHVSGPAEVLWLEHCGHVPHLEKRTAVIEAFGSFIRSVGMTA
ncbi:MAG: alpha/beta hydrolase [Bacteroidetes bacterium]|nr:alpha/beta hydrolase [Bacteroidota bacterium]